jgi:hypothetical protein
MVRSALRAGFLCTTLCLAATMARGETLFSLPAASGERTTVFGEDTIRVDWVTPGGRVFWHGVGLDRRAETWSTVVVRAGEAEDFDGDGTVELEAEELTKGSDLVDEVALDALPEPRAIPPLSVWVFIDEKSSLTGIAPAPGFGLGALQVDATTFVAGSELLLVRGRTVDAYWTRPKVGAWHHRVRDGSELDEDLVGNRRVYLRVKDFVPRAPDGEPTPEALAEGDVVVVIDEESFRVQLLLVGDGEAKGP